MAIRETIGRVIGGIASPIVALGSFLRGARLFHPDGVLYRAEVRPLGDGEIAESLAGEALVRLSGATWRWPAGATRPDILGVAVRIHPDSDRAQDLLFASFRSVLTLPLGPLTTDTRDFLANTYHAVLPVRAPGLGVVKLRLVPQPVETRGADRRERLENAVREGSAVLSLEARRSDDAQYRPLAAIKLCELVPGGGEELTFNPFHAGLGIEPVGVLQGVRAVVYPASQLGRALALTARARAGETTRR